MEKTIDFLLRAKKATYAGNGPKMQSSRPNSHDLEYIEGELKYIDTYLGGEKFSGEETLWQDDIPFWSMNYCGRVLGDGFSGDFLKEALSKVERDQPFRGPSEYTKDAFSYKCVVEGDFHWFKGFEVMFFNDEKVYECMFHGGAICL
jgi:hypothetical protein